MTIPSTRIIIPFQPLLLSITETLQLGVPQYEVLDSKRNVVAVTIVCKRTLEDSVYLSDPSSNLEEACNRAARLAVSNLIMVYDIYVPDFSDAKRQSYERCTNLWRLKQEEIKRIMRNLPKTPLVEEFTSPHLYRQNSVNLDMDSIFTIFAKKLPIKCSIATVLEQAKNSYICWMTIDHSTNNDLPACVIGDVSSTVDAARQSLAYKAIQYLCPIYNVEIIDVNYNSAEIKYAPLMCRCAHEKYKRLERALKESLVNGDAGGQSDVDVCTTPRGNAHIIPVSANPPPPPKKQRIAATPSNVLVHPFVNNVTNASFGESFLGSAFM